MNLLSAGRNCPRQCLLALILTLLASLSAPAAFSATFPQKVDIKEPSGQEVEQMLSIAEQQFEIVKILIKQDRFDQVLPEMRKIYDLNLPEKYEQATAESASLAANLLLEKGQFSLAHQVLDEAFGHMRRNENKAALLKVKAYVYKSEGNLEKARETFRRAIELEKQVTSP
jgi:tetratricopeptide (TPR) repeat protein